MYVKSIITVDAELGPNSRGREAAMHSALLLLLAAAAPSAQGLTANFSNVLVRRDVRGLAVNAHSGNLYRFGALFYLYGTAYPNCSQPGPVCSTACGYYNDSFAVYSSPDLAA